LGEIVEECEAALFSVELAGLLEAAEFAASGSAGLVGREAAAEIFFGEGVEMGLKFVVEVGVEARSVGGGEQALEEGAEHRPKPPLFEVPGGHTHQRDGSAKLLSVLLNRKSGVICFTECKRPPHWTAQGE
jgi:hypothetical protein